MKNQSKYEAKYEKMCRATSKQLLPSRKQNGGFELASL